MEASANAAVVTVDEELWFGSVGDDKEQEERAAQSMAAVAARVLGAKPFPAAARRLEELTRSGGARIEQVVGVLESDPGLSMRLLRLVNSAGYALRVRCTSVRHAAALVGMRRLHQLATTAAVLDLFETGNPAIKSLLSHAAVVGAFCRYLAVHVDLAPDELFTCGFLHDIGKLMLIDAEGATYVELVEKAGESPDALHRLEQEVYGFDHAVLGAHVLKNWRIPNPVPRVVAWHHNVARAYQSDPAIAAMVQALRLADQLSYLVRTHSEAEGILVAAQSGAASYLGVSEAQLSSMWADLARLSQRINAQPGGADQAEIIPREESIRPSMRAKKKKKASELPKTSLAPGASLAPLASAAPPADGPVSEMPKHFVCIVCNKASYGNRCPVCSGHVCAQHQVGTAQWCTQCTAAFEADVGSDAFPLWERITALGIVLGASLLSLLVAVLAGRPIVGALLGSTLLSTLCVLLVLVGRRFWLKRRFFRTRARSHASDEPTLPLGLSMPPEPSIAMLSDSPSISISPTYSLPVSIPAHELRPTERINPQRDSDGDSVPPLFSQAPAASGAAIEPAPSVPVPALSPSVVSQAVLSPHNGRSGPAAATARVPAHEPHRPVVVEPSVQSAPPPGAAGGPDSLPPDATGWRPIERTQPVMPVSNSGGDLRRLAEELPSLPPSPDPLDAGGPPSEHPALRVSDTARLVAATAPTQLSLAAAPAHASIATAGDERTSLTSGTLASTTDTTPEPAPAAPRARVLPAEASAGNTQRPPASSPYAVPAPAHAPVAMEPPSSLAAESAPASDSNPAAAASAPGSAPEREPASGAPDSEPEADSAPVPPDTTPSFAAEPPTRLDGGMTPSLPDASCESPPQPEPPDLAPRFVPLACRAVEPSLLVACRPVSLRPQHYACSPATGR